MEITSLFKRNQGRNGLVGLEKARDVPPAELHRALAWQMKDRLNVPVEEAILDTIALPKDISRQERSKVYVASAHKSIIRQAIADTHYAGLNLLSIDIFDMSLRNLIDLWGCDERGDVLVVIQRGRGEIVMLRQQQLYLSGKFKLDYQGEADEPLPLPQLDLEIQQALNYFEQQLGQQLPKKIHLTGQSVRLEKLSPEFQQGIAIPIELMAIHGYWLNHRDRGGVVDVNGLAAIGAALHKHLGVASGLGATA